MAEGGEGLAGAPRELWERLFRRYRGRPVVVYVSEASLEAARMVLERIGGAAGRGALVVYPTDTVYGVGTSPFIGDAVRRVFQAKERPLGKPLPVLVSSVEAAERLVVVSEEARRLMERFWPGGLTLVLPLRRGSGVAEEVHAGTGRLGVRMPAHRVALRLIEAAGGALVGTSANLHGRPSPRTAAEALEQLGDRVDYIVDSGPAPGGVPSTVVDLSSGEPVLLREGAVPAEEVERVLGRRLRRPG